MAVSPEAERRFYSTDPRHSSMAGGVEENSLPRLRRTPNRPTLDRTTNHDDADEQHARPDHPKSVQGEPRGQERQRSRSQRHQPQRRLGSAVLPGEGIVVPIGAAALYGGGRAQWIRPPVSSRRHPPSARSSSDSRRTPNICSVPRFCEQYFGRPHQAGDLTERGNLGRPIGDHATAARPVAVRWATRNWRTRDDRAGWGPAWTMTP